MFKIIGNFFSPQEIPPPKKTAGIDPYIRVINEANQSSDLGAFLGKLQPLSGKQIINQTNQYDKDLVLELFNSVIEGKPLPSGQLTVSRDELTDSFYILHTILKAEKLIEHLETLDPEKRAAVFATSKKNFGLTLKEFINIISNDRNLELLGKKPGDRDALIPVTSETAETVLAVCSQLPEKAVKEPLIKAIQQVVTNSNYKLINNELKKPIEDKLLLEALYKDPNLKKMPLVRELKTKVAAQLLQEFTDAADLNLFWDKNSDLYGLNFETALIFCRSTDIDLPDREKLAFYILDAMRKIKDKSRFLNQCINYLGPIPFEEAIQQAASLKHLSNPEVFAICYSDRFLQPVREAIKNADADTVIPIIHAVMDPKAFQKSLIPFLNELIQKVISENLDKPHDEFLNTLGSPKQIGRIKELLGGDFLKNCLESLKIENIGESLLYRETHFKELFNTLSNEKDPLLKQIIFQGASAGYYNEVKPEITYILFVSQKEKKLFIEKTALIKMMRDTLITEMKKNGNIDDILNKTDLVRFLGEFEKITNTSLLNVFDQMNPNVKNTANFKKCYETVQAVACLKEFAASKVWSGIPFETAVEPLITTSMLSPEEKLTIFDTCMNLSSTKKVLVKKREAVTKLLSAFFQQNDEAFFASCQAKFGMTFEQAIDFATSTPLLGNDASFKLFARCVQTPTVKEAFLKKCESTLNQHLLGFKVEFDKIPSFFLNQLSNEENKLIYKILKHSPSLSFRTNVTREQLTSLYQVLIPESHLAYAPLNESKLRSIKSLNDIKNVNDILFLSDKKIDKLLHQNGIDVDRIFGAKLDANYFKMILLAQLIVNKENTLKFVSSLKALKNECIAMNKVAVNQILQDLQELIKNLKLFIEKNPDVEQELELPNAARTVLELVYQGNVQVFTDTLLQPFSTAQSGRIGRTKDRLAFFNSKVADFKKFDKNYESFINFDPYQFYKLNVSYRGVWDNIKFAPNGDFLSGDYHVTYKTHEGDTKSKFITLDLNNLETIPSKLTLSNELSKLQSTYDLPENPTELESAIADFNYRLTILSNKLRYEILD